MKPYDTITTTEINACNAAQYEDELTARQECNVAVCPTQASTDWRTAWYAGAREIDGSKYQTLAEHLEVLIDTHSLGALIQRMAEVCGEKADHIAASYGDKVLAKRWRSDAKKLARLTLNDTE